MIYLCTSYFADIRAQKKMQNWHINKDVEHEGDTRQIAVQFWLQVPK